MASWWPTKPSKGAGEWRLDIVSLLAVIGESSMEAHSQAITASWTCILPRLVPAPQALLKPSRPTRMPQFGASVIGVSNGVLVPLLNYFPNIIHPIEDMPRFAFKVLKIVHTDDVENRPATSPTLSNNESFVKQSGSTSIELNRLEEGGIPRKLIHSQTSKSQKIINIQDKDKPRVPPQTYSPLNVLSIGSCIATIGLFIAAALIGDGTAMVAIGTISLNSSIVGYASSWRPTLTKRTFQDKVPPGDVVVLQKEGAFLFVKCNEAVARELYSGPDVCDYYVRTQHYRTLVGFGTVLLMASVVFLGNCTFPMQAAIGLSYILLNGLFWAVSLIKKKHFWDLSRYTWTDETPLDAKEAHKSQGAGNTTLTHPSYTRTLWYAIRETQSIKWVRTSGAAANTAVWDEWLAEAKRHAKGGNRSWDAVQAFKEIMKRKVDTESDDEDDIIEPILTGPAEQKVSAVDYASIKNTSEQI